jgi:hypothetical protein
MGSTDDSSNARDEAIPGEPLVDPVTVPVEPFPDPVGETVPFSGTEVAGAATFEPPSGAISAPVSEPVAPAVTSPPKDVSEESASGSKLKTGALVAGAAAVANKVRHDAPKLVRQLREKRAAGQCVIVSETDGETLAIGPYKDADAARQDLFKVGGTPRIVELVSETSFFAARDATSA